MIDIFYGIGIIEILISLYHVGKNWNSSKELTLKSLEETQSTLRKESMTWVFPFTILYLIWIIVGLFMPECFLFSLLVIISIVFPISILIINIPAKIFKFNHFIKLLILFLIAYKHYLA